MAAATQEVLEGRGERAEPESESAESAAAFVRRGPVVPLQLVPPTVLRDLVGVVGHFVAVIDAVVLQPAASEPVDAAVRMRVQVQVRRGRSGRAAHRHHAAERRHAGGAREQGKKEKKGAVEIRRSEERRSRVWRPQQDADRMRETSMLADLAVALRTAARRTVLFPSLLSLAPPLPRTLLPRPVFECTFVSHCDGAARRGWPGEWSRCWPSQRIDWFLTLRRLASSNNSGAREQVERAHEFA